MTMQAARRFDSEPGTPPLAGPASLSLEFAPVENGAETALDVHAEAGDRFVPTQAKRSRLDRWALPTLFVLFLTVHLGILAYVLAEYGLDQPDNAVEEIPVEIVQEPAAPPPEPPPPPPEPEQKKQEPPKEQPKPTYIKPAYDAPKAQNKETVEREAPDQETKSATVAPPPKQASETPETKPQETTATPPGPQAEDAAQKPVDDKPEAEAIEQAVPTPAKPGETASTKPAKAPPSNAVPTFVQQMANYQSTPDYKLAGAPKPSPVSGGSADTTYFSILYGLIMPHMKYPPATKGRLKGEIIIIIDTVGHILHTSLFSPSGSKELDNAAMAAVRAGAPFPPPPAGLPPIMFTYGSQ